MTTPKLLLVCLASAGWSISFGLGSQLVTLWLDSLDASNSFIGLNHAAYYLGLTLAALLVPRLLRAWGALLPVLGLFVSGLSLAAFPWMGGDIGSLACRFVSGMASAWTLIPLETIVSQESAPEQRTRNFGYYAVALTLGGAAGISLGPHFFVPGDTFPFWLGGALACATAVLLHRGLTMAALAEEKSSAPLDWRVNFLSFATGWCQGFLEGGMLAFLLLYLVERGLSKDTAGMLLSTAMVGVILFQVPVGWLADRLGRLPVLLACYAVVVAGLILVPCCEQTVWLAGWLLLLGACSGALYPLGLALLGDRVPPGALVRAYSWFLALECLGSQLGAASMGKARDWWGEDAMFHVGLAAVVAVLLTSAALAICGQRRQSREDNAEQRRAA